MNSCLWNASYLDFVWFNVMVLCNNSEVDDEWSWYAVYIYIYIYASQNSGQHHGRQILLKSTAI
jgi:hypothetical protein